MATYPMLHTERTNAQDKHNLAIQVTFGSSAVASYKGQALAFERNSAGNYDLTLPMPYLKVLSLEQGWKRASGAILQARLVDVSAIGTTGVLVLETVVNAGTATDPSNGDVLYLTVGVTQDPLNEEYGG